MCFKKHFKLKVMIILETWNNKRKKKMQKWGKRSTTHNSCICFLDFLFLRALRSKEEGQPRERMGQDIHCSYGLLQKVVVKAL